MRIITRFLPALTVAALAANGIAGQAAQLPSGHAADVPRLAGMRDLGRAPSSLPVSVAVTLNYRHDQELEQLVRLQSDPRSPLYHRFLTNEQFNEYFAPAQEDYARAQRALERAGFRITHTFSNRTVIDAVAPAASAERYFSTEIHRVAQPGATGIRYANVSPAVVPTELRGILGTVAGLNNLDVVRPLHRFAGPGQRLAQQQRARLLAQSIGTRPAGKPATPVRLRPPVTRLRRQVSANATNVVADAGFESGGYAYWQQTGTVNAGVTPARAHSGRFSEFAGTTSGGEVDGDAGLSQLVTVPAGGVLSFWVYQGSTEPNSNYAWQWAALLDASGNVADSLYQTVDNTNGWKRLTYDVSAYAGRSLYLYFGVHGDGWRGYTTYQFVADVSLMAGNATSRQRRVVSSP